MSDQNHQTKMPIDPTVDPYGYLRLVRHSDGSITRLPVAVIPVDTCKFSNLVATKDLDINPSKNTWARIILPRQVLLEYPTTPYKLPLVIFFHGGGFVVASVDAPIFQSFYASSASEIPAIVVSIGYRRAPEHRLPAAYEDCMEALHWIKNKPDEWLANYADFSNCFLMGTSSGANITYHLGLGLAAEGADRDHEYSNPMVAIKANPNLFDHVKLLGWKILVRSCDGDPLIDRQINLVRVLKELGVQVVDSFTQEGCHGLEIADPSTGKEFLKALKEFVTAP